MNKRGRRYRQDTNKNKFLILQDKRGQFYLAAAIIIMTIILGLAMVRNSSEKPADDTTVYDLKEELNLESGKVVDFAIYNNEETEKMLDNWTEVYADLSKDKVESMVFVYGNKTGLYAVYYANATAGAITIGSGGSVPVVVSRREKKPVPSAGNMINVTLGDYSYNFELQEGKNFMFLIKKGGYITES